MLPDSPDARAIPRRLPRTSTRAAWPRCRAAVDARRARGRARPAPRRPARRAPRRSRRRSARCRPRTGATAGPRIQRGQDEAIEARSTSAATTLAAARRRSPHMRSHHAGAPALARRRSIRSPLVIDEIVGDLPRARLHRRARPRSRDRVVQLRRAELPGRPSGDGHARHAVPRRRRAAAHAHVAGAGAHAAALRAARSASSRPGNVYRRDFFDASHAPVFAQIEGLAVDEGISLRRPQGDADALRAALLRRDTHALSSELLPVHRAVGRDGRRVPAVRRTRLLGVQGHRLDGDPRLRDGASRRARSGGHRQRAVHRVGVRHGAGSHRHVALRHLRTSACSTTPTCASSSRSAR